MKEAKAIVELIKESNHIVITSHRGPDGDSIGCSMGLYQFIKALNKNAVICHPDACPEFLEWAKNGVLIHDYETEPEFVSDCMRDADLIFSLDYNGAGRLGDDMGDLLMKASAKKVMIDHHPNPENIFDITVSEPSVCSTSQLIFELIDGSGNLNLLNTDIGAPIYLGIMTDTGSFRFSSVTARTHEVLSKLLSAGVDQSAIHEQTFDNNRIDKMKLRAYIIAERMELIPEHHIALISVTEPELERFNYVKGDTEGLVNVALSIEGVNVAVFFMQKGADVKLSFRSKGDIAVNKIARDHFSGGGHVNAAGGIFHGKVNEAIDSFISAMPNYF